MSFFHPSNHPLNPFGSDSGSRSKSFQSAQQKLESSVSQLRISGHPSSSPQQNMGVRQPFFPVAIANQSNQSPRIASNMTSSLGSPGTARVHRVPHDDMNMQEQIGLMAGHRTQSEAQSKRKIYVRTDDEQFALPLSKVQTNEGLISFLTRFYSPDQLPRVQIRYDSTVLDADGTIKGPICGGAVIYPEYWESLVEDSMRILIRILPTDSDMPAHSIESDSESGAIHTISSDTTRSDILSASGLASSFNDAESSATMDLKHSENNLGTDMFGKENAIADPPRTYSAVAKRSVAPLSVSTNAAKPVSLLSSGGSKQVAQVTMMPEDTSSLYQRKYKSGRMSAMSVDEALQLVESDPFSLTYLASITILAPMLPEWRRLTHPRLSPNIVTIRPCNENTLWIFCVVQKTLHPITVRAFETIDIEELILRVVPPEVGKEKTVVLWRNMKFGGEGLPPSTYQAKRETRGTGGRVMWKKNLAVLAVKNAEVFVLVYKSVDTDWKPQPNALLEEMQPDKLVAAKRKSKSRTTNEDDTLSEDGKLFGTEHLRSDQHDVEKDQMSDDSADIAVKYFEKHDSVRYSMEDED
ncbi:uncharacterized protein V1516DRAFT_681256 [Lipomyces oligophaga]|uniref:uncharacterized protein n=1 Tax=Lipomyces oligophaga TaxID=45792 RepID=UPI0034CFED58